MANVNTTVAIRRYAGRLLRNAQQRDAISILQRTLSSEMKESREDVIKFFAGNVIQRYKKQTKDIIDPPTLGVWLEGKKLEDTYLIGQGNRGNSLSRRQGYAARVVKEGTRELNSPQGSTSDQWLIQGTEDVLNAFIPQAKNPIKIYRTNTTSRKYPNNATYGFIAQ
jgi:hypothetical protein